MQILCCGNLFDVQSGSCHCISIFNSLQEFEPFTDLVHSASFLGFYVSFFQFVSTAFSHILAIYIFMRCSFFTHSSNLYIYAVQPITFHILVARQYVEDCKSHKLSWRLLFSEVIFYTHYILHTSSSLNML